MSKKSLQIYTGIRKYNCKIDYIYGQIDNWLFCLFRGLTYKDSGVDIAAGNTLVQKIKPLAAATSRSGKITYSYYIL